MMNSKELREKWEVNANNAFSIQGWIQGQNDILMEAMCELLDRSELDE